MTAEERKLSPEWAGHPGNWQLAVFAGLEVVKAIWDSSSNHYDAPDIRSNGVIVGRDRFIWTIDRRGEAMVARLTLEEDSFRGGAERINGSVPIEYCTTPAAIVENFRWDA